MTGPDHKWEFGGFRLDPSQRLLFRDGQIVPLTPKAAEVLTVLVTHHGQLVEKEALMRQVWPDSFVEESNLAVHVSNLRKVIAEDGEQSGLKPSPAAVIVCWAQSSGSKRPSLRRPLFRRYQSSKRRPRGCRQGAEVARGTFG